MSGQLSQVIAVGFLSYVCVCVYGFVRELVHNGSLELPANYHNSYDHLITTSRVIYLT